jgi:hypothetical protein
MSKLTSAFMKKHLTLFNKMVRAETYKGVAKMKYDQVKEAFNRDFREIESGKDGKTFYAPKTYQIDLDSDDKFTPILKELSKNLLQNKPKKASMTKEQLEAGAKKALSNTAAGKRMDAKKAKAAPKPKPKKTVNKSVDEVKAMLQKVSTPKPVGKAKARLAAAAAAQAKAAPLSASGSARRVKKA